MTMLKTSKKPITICAKCELECKKLLEVHNRPDRA